MRYSTYQRNTTNQLINIGAGEDYTIREFAEKICSIVGYEHNLIEYDTSKYVGATTKKLSIEVLEKLMPDYFENKTTLEKGLNKVIQWFDESKFY